MLKNPPRFTFLQAIEVPDEGSGRYWYVCDIDGASGNITIVNQSTSGDENDGILFEDQK